MKLARKLILTMVVGLTVVLSANAYYRVRRELAAFDTDMKQDHEVLAQVLENAVTAVWINKGRDAALQLIATVKPPSDMLRIRWRDGENPENDSAKSKALVTHVPITIAGKVMGFVEVSESRDFAHRYVRTTVIRSLVLTLIAIASIGGLTTVLGIWFVGKPIEELVKRAARIGAGDVDSQLIIHQRDELGDLATEMNTMCLRLVETRQALTAETEERLRAQDQLRHADRLATVGKLASGIAHELGTPLGVALMRANMIASNPTLGRDTREAAHTISEQIDRITRIVRQLLDFARGRGTAPPGPLARRTPTDLLAIAQHATEMLQPLAIKRNLLIEIVHDGTLPKPPANSEQIEQVLVNLLVNAIHASERSGKVTITLGTSEGRPPADLTPPVLGEDGEPRYALISVKDEGIGIAPDVLPRIFEPFFTTKHVGEGTGLGLSVAYGIVREHSGWIEVMSERNRGSCFSVYLPLDLAEVLWESSDESLPPLRTGG
jgi:signal transduction histidine kinase